MKSLAHDSNAHVRFLVACRRCKRQYDASQRHTGDGFYCRCGELVTVPTERGHAAAVVRCSACGGVRLNQRPACTYCGADFTLHERDLHTICPECTARISDRARFCHYCATPIVPVGSAGESTEYDCPACGAERQLFSRALSDARVSVMECGGCGGMWLDNTVFELLEERATRSAASDTTHEHEKHRGQGTQAQDRHGRFYRKCPRCDALMHRRNYGRRSGVLVDTCKQHGIWLDFGELDVILRWIKTGGLSNAEKWEKQRVDEGKKATKLLRDIDRQRATWAPDSPSRGAGGADLVARILGFLID